MKVLESPIIDLSLGRLAICYALVGLVAVFLRIWRAPSEREVYGATLRMTVQLAAAAFVLTFLFSMNRAVWILGMLVLMWQVASIVALRPLKSGKRQLYPMSCLSLALGAGVTLWVITVWVLQLDPWYNPRYFLPIAGMILANSMNGVSLAVDRVSVEMELRAGEIRKALAQGRTPWEASLPALHKAYQTALLPTINSMLVVGIVAFPGMMTGQILSGTVPIIAVKYQVMVMCMLLASIGISTPIFLRLTFKHFLPKEL